MEGIESLVDYGGYRIREVQRDDSTKELDIYLEMKTSTVRCAVCNKEVKYVREKYERRVRDLPIGEYIIVKVHYLVKIFI